MSIFWALMIPVIIFLGVIIPTWIIFHYITLWIRTRSGEGAEPVASAELDQLRALADRLEQRLASIETILDADAPDWRHK